MARLFVLRQGGEKPDEYWKIFPPFLWLLRDVLLDIPKQDGKDVSPTEFLKNEVLCCNENSKGADVRRALTQFFPKFTCETLPLPSASNEVMKQVSTNQDKLQPLFNKGVDELIAFLKTNVKPKKVFTATGSACDGPTLATLVTVVADAVNDPESIPALDNTWKLVVESRCRSVQERLLADYSATIKARYEEASKGGPIDEVHRPDSDCGGSVMGIHRDIWTQIMSKLHTELGPLLSSQVIEECTLESVTEQLEKQLVQYEWETDPRIQVNVRKVVGGAIFPVIEENRKRSWKFCNQLFNDLYDPIKEQVAAGKDGYTADDLAVDIEKLLEKYDQNSIGPEKWHVRVQVEKIIEQNKKILEKHLEELLKRSQEQRAAAELSSKLKGELQSLQESRKQFEELVKTQQEFEEERRKQREDEIEDLKREIKKLQKNEKEMHEKEIKRRVQEVKQLAEEQYEREKVEDKLKDMVEALENNKAEEEKRKAKFDEDMQRMRHLMKERDIAENNRKLMAQKEIQNLQRQISEMQQTLEQREEEEKQRKAQADDAQKKMQQRLKDRERKEAEERAKFERIIKGKANEINKQQLKLTELQANHEEITEKIQKEKEEETRQKEQAKKDLEVTKKRLEQAAKESNNKDKLLDKWKEDWDALNKEIESKWLKLPFVDVKIDVGVRKSKKN